MNVLYSGLGMVAQGLSDATEFADSQLESQLPSTLIKSPTLMLLTGVITVIGAKMLAYYVQPRWGETGREKLGRLIMHIPAAKKEYDKDIEKELTHQKEKVREKWQKFGEPIRALPEDGWSIKQLLDLIIKYSEITASGLQGKHISGTVYSKSLDQGYQEIKAPEFQELDSNSFKNDEDYFAYLSKKVEYISSIAVKASRLWNSLHGDEFSVGSFIDYQLTRMVANMFGGKPDEVMGFVTTGGTGSLMLGVRLLREWGEREKGIPVGECVIIACKTAHAALTKGGESFKVKIELVDEDEKGQMDLQKLREALKKHGKNVVGVVGSGPSYPKGVVDPIKQIAEIAQEHEIGCLVDCCLGGFLVNNVLENQAPYLTYPGVTMVSTDTHKNGWDSKGSSTLITKKLGEKNLAYYSIFALPDSGIGVYGTPDEPGSKSCSPSFTAFLTLLAIGQKGYQRIAQAIYQTTCDLGNIIKEFKGELKLCAQPEVNVFALQIDPKWGVKKGAIYSFAHEMEKRNFIFNTLNNEMIHFCVTGRLAGNQKAIAEFRQAIKDSLDAVKQENDKIVKEGGEFKGQAGTYCKLNQAMAPNKEELSFFDYVKYFVFGRLGAKDAVRSYFLAHFDPYTQK